ncbi:unnamed protein product, partial [Durusdinium trenchii]
MASECGPAGFTSVKHSFSWPTVFLNRICGQFGEGYVAQRLRQWRWSCSTAFSGVGAPESALMSLQSAAKDFLQTTNSRTKNVVFTSTCECDRACQQVLKHTYGACNWPDITQLDASKPTAFCTTHEKNCRIHIAAPKRLRVTVAGPVCISFSLMGKKEGVSSPAFKTHEGFYRQAPLMADVLILENVTEYSPELVQSQLGKSWTLQHCKIDPRLFGLPAARARIYLIAYKHDIVSWRQEVSLELVLGALASRVVRDAGMYTWMSLPPMTLSAAQERNLKEYDQDVRLEGKRFPDLNQLARNGRG